MQLTIIGAAPAYTSRRGAAASSYLVQATAAEGGPASLVLDLGQGSFSNLAATAEPSTLTAVLVSHLHPDHFIDLIALRHYLKWEFNPPRRAAVLAPAGLAERLDALDGHAGFTAEALDVAPLEVGVRRIGPFAVETRLVTHTEESYAFRVSIAVSPGESGGDNGPGTGSSDPGRRHGPGSSGGGDLGNGNGRRGLVYSGDCASTDGYVPLIRPGDTLLSEATSGDKPVPPGARHITAADAARAASSGGAARLLLTHILAGSSRDETYAVARSAFEGTVRLVTEGESFEI
jgi:ribonuclease BN (tRNA processing enzyme)